MSRSLGILCAGALLVATAGCTLDSFFLSISGSSNRQEQTVPLSLDQVKLSLRSTLGKSFGIVMLDESKNGEEVRLAGATNTGKKFVFILQRQKSDFGERTMVAFEGEKEASDLLWRSVLLSFASSPAPQQPPQGSYVPNQPLPGAPSQTVYPH
jgi:hypothetical protein